MKCCYKNNIRNKCKSTIFLGHTYMYNFTYMLHNFAYNIVLKRKTHNVKIRVQYRYLK